jgi:hypothetical protein
MSWTPLEQLQNSSSSGIALKLFQYRVRFQFLMAPGLKITAFWDTVLCSLIELDQCFRDAHSLHQGDGTNVVGNMHLWNVALL